jgi:hypothetical protein
MAISARRREADEMQVGLAVASPTLPGFARGCKRLKTGHNGAERVYCDRHITSKAQWPKIKTRRPKVQVGRTRP